MNRFLKGESEKIYCIKCNKYKKFKNSNISYISDTCDTCGSNDEKIFREENLIKMLKILGLINDMKE